MVVINGTPADVAGITLSEYLAQQGFEQSRLACEINESIVPKTKYDETVLHDGDKVEIVRFVGGG